MRFIVVSDIHMRLTDLECRTDNYAETAMRKINFVNDVAGASPVLNVGDFWNTPLPQGYETLLPSLEKKMYNWISIAGNHELKNHDIDSIDTVAYGILSRLIRDDYTKRYFEYNDFDITRCHFGQEPPTPPSNSKTHVLMLHTLTFKTGQGKFGTSSTYLLDKYKDFDIILTGDNHQEFTDNLGGRILINPGSLMRTSAKQYNYKPVIYEVNDEKIIKHEVPIASVMRREYRDREKKLEMSKESLALFIDKTKKSHGVTFDFIENLKEREIPEKLNEIKQEVLSELYT